MTTYEVHVLEDFWFEELIINKIVSYDYALTTYKRHVKYDPFRARLLAIRNDGTSSIDRSYYRDKHMSISRICAEMDVL